MPSSEAPFEIHVHGQIQMRPDVTHAQLEEVLRPLWSYCGANSLEAGASSSYEEEPGIVFEQSSHTLQICWTVAGGEDFRQALDDLCMALNDVAQEGAAIEVTFFDAEFDDDDEDADREEDSRDDFLMLFVGPTPAAIMGAQRDLLVQDIIHMMERHFDASELVGVVSEIDKLFMQRFDNLVNSLNIGKPPSRGGGSGGSGSSGSGGRGRRHLH